MRKCWECFKVRNYKCDYKLARVEKSKGFEEENSTEEKGDLYVSLTSTQSNQYSWFIDFDSSYNMTPHREWF